MSQDKQKAEERRRKRQTKMGGSSLVEAKIVLLGDSGVGKSSIA